MDKLERLFANSFIVEEEFISLKRALRNILFEAFLAGEKTAVGITAKYVLTKECLINEFEKWLNNEDSSN